MSQFTDWAENKLADQARGQGLTLPTNWYLAFLEEDSDGGFVELTGIGLSRVPVARSLANFAGTQGSGSVLASSGTSHTTSNNEDIAMGTASGSGEATAVGFFDASSSGHMWMRFSLSAPLPIEPSDTPTLAAGLLAFTLGLSGGMSDYLSNKLIDQLFRGQAYAWPATLYVAGMTSAPSNAGGGTEVGGGLGYARAPIDSDMVDWSGTQGPGATTASTGTGGRISNNVAVAHPAPTGDQGTWTHGAIYDASTLGNLMWWRAQNSPRTVSAGGSPPTYPINTLGIRWD